MNGLSANTLEVGEMALQIYLLGVVDFATVLRLQKRLVYDISGQRDQAALILCEHPPLITVGRQGSRAHLLCDEDELRARQWDVRWVNRGGGCLLHLPGQLAIYPILPLDRLQLGVSAYLAQLQVALADVLADFSVQATSCEKAGVWVGERPIAAVGVAVRDWVSYFGAVLNLNVPLEPFRLIRWGGPLTEPMTSLERERRGPVRPSLVRQRLIEHFRNRFGFARTALFSEHVSLNDTMTHAAEWLLPKTSALTGLL